VGEEFSVFELFSHEDVGIYGASLTENSHKAKIWEFQGESLAEKYRLEGHKSPVLSLAVAPDSSRVVTGARDGGAFFWSCHDGRLLGEVETKFSSISSLAFSGEPQQQLVSGQ